MIWKKSNKSVCVCYRGGLSNRVYTCENLAGGDPEKVLLRFYGGNLIDETDPGRALPKASEVLIYCKMGELGLGPKIFGIFEGGRVEEFIPVITIHWNYWLIRFASSF